MRRLALFVCVFFLPVIFLFISCRTEHLRITAIRILAVEKVDDFDCQEVDDAIETLIIQIEPIQEKVSENKMLKSLSQPLYAAFDPDDPTMDNEIIYEKTELLLDRDIYYKEQLIEKGTDLRSHSSIKDLARVVYISNPSQKLYGFGIGFSEEFYANINIPEGEYTITVICHTNDELELKSSLVKTIKLKKE